MAGECYSRFESSSQALLGSGYHGSSASLTKLSLRLRLRLRSSAKRWLCAAVLVVESLAGLSARPRAAPVAARWRGCAGPVRRTGAKSPPAGRSAAAAKAMLPVVHPLQLAAQFFAFLP